ncbi:hypothetical protein E1287_36150 [Actinomadura sp. KC06]|uniref:hypothetical protein n=1 Tax=Actinomadura sp. KC06 TaxID=2530369 RepID=UPI00104CB018|nr:hypothetical protein [Actinomadura sp. KC06]TDD26654.1 hypothetical protein E1287_36150 [Actinomadura sp. KC06]
MDRSDDLLTQRTEMARVLGLNEPVPESVLRAALADDSYATNLLICRRRPDLLQHLLDKPPQRTDRDIPARELLAKGTAALARWARTGFSVVDEATYARRTQACRQCPSLRQPESSGARRALRAVSTAGLDDKAMCGMCGCTISQKARLPTEQCPARHPDDPGKTRWGEQVDSTT